MTLSALIAVAVSACSSAAEPGNSSSPSGSQSAGSAAPAAAGPAYDGPEAGLPHSYGVVAKKGGVKCVIGYQDISAEQQALLAQATGAAAEARKLGCQIKVLDDQLSLTTQVNNFSQLLAEKVSAIIVYPIVPSALQPEINKAAAAHIPVIAIQTPVSADQPTPKGYATSVLQGLDTAAYARAKAVAAKHPGANFVVQALAVPVASLQYFAAREQYWGKRFGLHYLGEVENQADTPAASAVTMAAALAKYPTMNALFTYNDDNAGGDATTARASGHGGILIAGLTGQLSAFNGIKDGSIFCTYEPEWTTIGKLTVDAAYDLITRQNLPLPRLVVDSGTLVTKTNVDSVGALGS